MENQTTATRELPVIRTSVVLDMLRQGMKRTEIEAHYGLNKASAKALWSNPDLKKKKTAREGNEVLIQVVSDVPAEAPKTPRPPKVAAEVTESTAPVAASNGVAEQPAPVAASNPLLDAQPVAAQPVAQPQVQPVVEPVTTEGGWG